MGLTTHTIVNIAERWPVGTLVSVYERRRRSGNGRFVGEPVSTGTVQPGGWVTFPGLTFFDVPYIADAVVDGEPRQVEFRAKKLRPTNLAGEPY